nr:immunoglobulin heavy chain junction region [Macaca mulatta]
CAGGGLAAAGPDSW